MASESWLRLGDSSNARQPGSVAPDLSDRMPIHHFVRWAILSSIDDHSCRLFSAQNKAFTV